MLLLVPYSPPPLSPLPQLMPDAVGAPSGPACSACGPACDSSSAAAESLGGLFADRASSAPTTSTASASTPGPAGRGRYGSGSSSAANAAGAGRVRKLDGDVDVPGCARGGDEPTAEPLTRAVENGGTRRLADQRGGQELLDDAVSLLVGVRAGKAVGAMASEQAAAACVEDADHLQAEMDCGHAEEGMQATETGDDAEMDGERQGSSSAVDSGGADGNGIDSGGGSSGGGDGNGGGGSGSGADGSSSGDEEVRNTVRSEMAAAGMTQYTVAIQAGVSQPVLCTYLGGKSNGKSNGKNSRIAVRAKLLAWLASRGVALLPFEPPSSTSNLPGSAPGSPNLLQPPDAALAPNASCAHLASAATASSDVISSKKQPVGVGVAGGCSKIARQDSAASASGVSSSCGGGGKATGNGKSGSSGKAIEGGGGKSNKGHGGGSGGQGKSIKLTPHHLHVAYIWYLKQRDAEGIGLKPGEEEAFCLNCKDGGDVLLCDYGGCTKSFHIRCCGLKSVPEGIWECPRHRCISCGSGPSQTDAFGRPRKPDTDAASTLWPCRTCPTTYCERCLPEEISFAGEEVRACA